MGKALDELRKKIYGNPEPVPRKNDHHKDLREEFLPLLQHKKDLRNPKDLVAG